MDVSRLNKSTHHPTNKKPHYRARVDVLKRIDIISA